MAFIDHQSLVCSKARITTYYNLRRRLAFYLIFLASYCGLGGGESYLGCFQISTGNPSYHGAMDVPTCISTCESDGYMLLLNTSGIVCYCATTNETTTDRTDCSECTTGYYCGDVPGIYGLYELDVSSATSTTTQATSATSGSSSSSFTDTATDDSSSEGTWSIVVILAVAETTSLVLLATIVTVAVRCCYRRKYILKQQTNISPQTTEQPQQTRKTAWK